MGARVQQQCALHDAPCTLASPAQRSMAQQTGRAREGAPHRRELESRLYNIQLALLASLAENCPKGQMAAWCTALTTLHKALGAQSKGSHAIRAVDLLGA